MQDRDGLQKQVCDQLKQMSHLRSQIDDLSLIGSNRSAASDAGDELADLKTKVSHLNEALQVRDKEVHI